VLLVSADFFASEQCFGVEMHYAREQQGWKCTTHGNNT
jgi:hypothetical protein